MGVQSAMRGVKVTPRAITSSSFAGVRARETRPEPLGDGHLTKTVLS